LQQVSWRSRQIKQMNVNWGTIVTSLAAETALFLLLLRLFWQTFSDRMLAKLKAANETELESVKRAHAQLLAAYQHELDKTILVTRVHFETEFAAIKEVFQKLAKVRLELAGIRPSFGIASPNETPNDKLKALSGRLEKLTAAYNDLVTTTENLSPFYPREIYLQIDECRQAVWMEITDVQTAGDDTFTHGWFQQGENNRNRFMKAYNTVSLLIREHIAKLAIARPL
jgi:hypothetical protein